MGAARAQPSVAIPFVSVESDIATHRLLIRLTAGVPSSLRCMEKKS